jgi:hypothetical protein
MTLIPFAKRMMIRSTIIAIRTFKIIPIFPPFTLQFFKIKPF